MESDSISPSTAPRAPTRGIVLVAVLAPLLAACGGGDNAKKADAAPLPPEQLYNNGMDALNAKKYETAANQFNDIEQNYPYSSWAPRAQLMEGYTQYVRQRYPEAIATLDRYIQLHPASRETAYAYYLRALSYFEQIEDVQRDQRNTQLALAALKDVASRYPGTDYARDAQLKIDLCQDHLAGKEMAIGRYYENQHLYTAAINRFQRVVQDYQTTNHVAEALHRLVEIYLILGMRDQARQTAAVLGYNYPGSSWYADSYGDLADDHVLLSTPAPRSGGPGLLTRAWRSIF